MEEVPQSGQASTLPVQEQSYNTPAGQSPAPVQPVQPVTPAQPFQTGGPAKGKWFDGITLTDVIVGTLVIAGLGLSVYYFRQRIKHAGREYPELRTDVDKLKQQLEDMKSPEGSPQFGMV